MRGARAWSGRWRSTNHASWTRANGSDLPFHGKERGKETCFSNGSVLNHFPSVRLEPALYLVSTPIGNMEDITMRALRVLRDADLLYVEDTRRTSLLLSRYGIQRGLRSFHEHNERKRIQEILHHVSGGGSVAMASDAGTPCVSDPGYLAVKAIRELGARVVPVPGPCAFVSAISASGLDGSNLTFRGFPSSKRKIRKEFLRMDSNAKQTVAYYVAPHDLIGFLEDTVEELGGDRNCCLAREITKMYEEFYNGTLQDALDEFRSRDPKGEFTVLIEGKRFATTATDEEIKEELQNTMREGCRRSEAVKIVSKRLDVNKNRVYEVAMDVQFPGPT